jgi:hypothetical protein
MLAEEKVKLAEEERLEREGTAATRMPTQNGIAPNPHPSSQIRLGPFSTRGTEYTSGRRDPYQTARRAPFAFYGHF